MLELIAAAGSAFGVIFVAELGDKTQLLALGFGARHSLRQVAIGLTIGYGVAGAIAALVGGVLGAALPERPIALGGGVLFLLFAVLALRSGAETEDGAGARVIKASTVIASIALTIAVGEMGDKTQLATAALAARSNPLAIWFGSTLGEVSAGMLGAIAGLKLGTKINPRILRLASAVLFAIFGLVLLISAA
jgi:Ca2+/H+ antiporter, TMEM165/GDT1 family